MNMNKYDSFRKIFIDYGGKTITYLNKELKDEERSKDIFFRLNLKLIRIWELKPEVLSHEQWLMFCIQGEIRKYYKHLAKTDPSKREKLQQINEQLYEWLVSFEDNVQQVILEQAVEFYTDESMQQSFEDKVDIFETLKRAKAYFEEKK